MEVFRHLRNCSGQLENSEKVEILNKFTRKLKRSGYKANTRANILRSGTTYYFRKLRIELQGGPRMNRRNDQNAVPKRRLKIGATENWFRRRRGGVKEAIKKENDWRLRQYVDNKTNNSVDNNKKTIRRVYHPGQRLTRVPTHNTTTTHQTTPRHPETTLRTHNTNTTQNTKNTTTPIYMQVEATLQVPNTKNSELCKRIQAAEDQLSMATRTKKIRIIERGGQRLIHALSRTDPGQNDRTCQRNNCKNCQGRLQIKEMIQQQKDQGHNTNNTKEKNGNQLPIAEEKEFATKLTA